MMRDLTELNKLEEYLIANNIKYERTDIDEESEAVEGFKTRVITNFERHQICVPCEGYGRKWDAVCQHGSYGEEEGLLEIMGDIVRPGTRDSVEGWLTADDVIERIIERRTI